MSQHLPTAIPAAGEDLRAAVAQTRLAGFTKTWTHLLAAALAVATAAMTDGDVTAVECLQIVSVLITAGLVWLVPGTALKVLVSLVLAAGGAAGPYFLLGWSGLTGDNLILMLIAVLGAVSSALLPNVDPEPLPPVAAAAVRAAATERSPLTAALGQHAQPAPSAPVRPQREHPVPAATAEDAPVDVDPRQEETAPSVPPVPAKTVSAIARLRRPRAEPAPSAQVSLEEEPDEPLVAPPRSSVRSSYLPPGSGATGVLPVQPAAGSSGEDPGPRGYDFGRP